MVYSVRGHLAVLALACWAAAADSSAALCGSAPFIGRLEVPQQDAPCLRLRGGFFNIPAGGAAGGRGAGETATADDFADASAADAAGGGAVAPAATAGAGAGAASTSADGAAAPPPVSVQQHLAEYALAGSLDGLRTGLGQSVGGQVNVFVTAALQSTARLTSLAFASAVCAFRERQVCGCWV